MGNMMHPVAAVYALAFYSMGALSQDQCPDQPLMKANSVISSGPLVVDGDVEDAESTPCLEVRLVLVWGEAGKFNATHHEPKPRPGRGRDPTPKDSDDLKTKNSVSGYNWNGVDWCPNGLYAKSGEKEGSPPVCDDCANCIEKTSCGNCKTKFTVKVDEYAVLRLQDALEILPVDGKCGRVLCNNQQFFLETGLDGAKMGVVRSSMLTYAQGGLVVGSGLGGGGEFYASIWVVEGYPRMVQWEQTADITLSCNPKLQVTYKESNEREWTSQCTCDPTLDSCKDDGQICAPVDASQYHATDCGFSTLPSKSMYGHGGKYTTGKFKGMWTGPGSGDNTNPLPPECSQNMCAMSKDSGMCPEGRFPTETGECPLDSATGYFPLQIYLTWAGTDVDGRNLVSKGTSYASFRQYSTFEFAKNVADKATNVQQKMTSCVTDKNC